MNQDTDEYRTEKKKQEQELEALLLKRLKSNEAVLLTTAIFDEMKNRVASRLRAKKDIRETT